MSETKSNPNSIVQSIRHQDQVVIIDLAGEIDLHRATGLRGSLLEVMQKKPAVTVINLSRVEFMDSSGLATLIEALQLSRRFKGELKLVGIQQRVRSIFEIARLDSIFHIYDTEAEALAS
jgi:anti-sigma B factor antagonist